MKVRKCDRCGKYFDNIPFYKKDGARIMKVEVRYLPSYSEVMECHDIDLCEDCLKKFIEFMENKS